MDKLKSLLLKAGIIPLPAWLIITTVAGFLATDYDPIGSHVSVMTLQDGPAHLLANIAALLAGFALIALGIGIWAQSKRVISVGALGWILFGIAMVTNGIWPMGSPLHGFYIIGIFSIIAPAMTLLDIRDEALREKLHTVTAFVSLSGMLYLWLALTGFEPEGYSGLFQRIFGSINYLWPLVFSWQFFRNKAASNP